MILSSQGEKVIQTLEGMRTRVYKDSGGEPTIGIGHMLTKAERTSGKIRIGDAYHRYAAGITEEQCWQLLRQDLNPVCECVTASLKVEVSQTQFDALVIFTFNVGNDAFENSTLLKLLNQGNYSAVPAQLARWIHDNGVAVNGLVNRRNAEIQIWKYGYASNITSMPEAIERPKIVLRTTTPTNRTELSMARKLQTLLKSAGYYDGLIDGVTGLKTSDAFYMLVGYYLPNDPRNKKEMEAIV